MNILNALFEKLIINKSDKNLQKSIIDLPNYYIFWKDKNSVFLGCNKAFATLAGLDSPEKIIGKNDYDFEWPKEYCDQFIADDKFVMESKQPKLNIEEPHVLPNGEKIIFHTTKVPLIDEKGNVYGILGICSNVTQQKLEKSNVQETNQKLVHAYQEARLLQASLMDHLPNYYIFWKDLNGKYVGCNKAFASLAGQNSPKNLIGKSDHDYWPEKESDAYVADDRAVMDSKQPKLNIEEPQTTPWGEKIVLSTSKVPLIDEKGNVYGLLGICANITQQKEAEQNLLEMNQKLEKAYQAKSEFIRNVSHDIRTPLSSILQSSRLTYEGVIGPEEIPEYSYHIWQASIRLMNLFNQVIEIAKVESYEFEDQVVKFDLHNLLNELEKTYQIVAKHKNLKLHIECSEQIPKYLLGKHLRLHRILMNLLGNAFKFTESGSVKLVVENAQSPSKEEVVLRFSIIDTGMGIPQDKHCIIFQPFERLQPAYQSQYPGSGLGLSLVKEYIAKMQGEIYLESSPGKGSKFTCIIPFKRPIIDDDKEITNIEYKMEELFMSEHLPLSSKSNVNLETPQENIKYHVLLVEDDVLAQKMGTKILSNMPGYKVKVASSGEEALEIAAKTSFDLIYTDIGLPGISGIETINQIKANPDNPNKNTYIAALTAHADDEITQQCLDAGMQQVLQKPLTLEKVQQIHQILIEKNQNQNHINPDVINWALWLKRVDGQQEMVELAFHLIAKDFENNLNAIKEAFNSKDTQKLQRITHKMKGALGYCGLTRLEKAVQEMEKAAKQEKMDDIPKYYSEVIDALNEVQNTYKDWAKTHPQ